MRETNIRIVKPGIELTLPTRCAKIKTLAPSAKMIEKVCNQFANRNSAAVYCPQRQQILVLTPNLISQFVVKDDKENWTVKVVDGGKNQKLQFSHSENDASLLAQLIERHVQIEIKRRSKMQTPDSPRIFQAPKPFDTVEDIDVYRRFEVSALPIQGIGVGISVDISTAFFSHWTVADVFRDDIPDIVELCNKVSQRNNFQALRSLLVLRDGRECEGELEAIYTAKQKLIERKFFTEEVTVDVVDFHKSIAKNLRLWEKMERNAVKQILEGEALILDNCTVVLTTTGAPTPYQGTADPVMIVGRSDGIDMVCVTKAVYASTHLNFSNPNVAQKLPLELKRTDDALTSRDSQEIRRIR